MSFSPALMQRTIEASRLAVGKSGLLPFAALILRNGEVVGEGLNHAVARHDPTAHGEVEAIRDACARLRTTDLSDCELYTSAEPCALCVSAMALAGISTYYYGASLDQAEASMALSGLQKGIDPFLLRREAGSAVAERTMRGSQQLDAAAQAVITAWAEAAQKARAG